MSLSSPQLAKSHDIGESREEFGPLAYLMHALNQPLTGLQCLLELAVTGPRTAEQYVRTMREGLELTARMRALVEALREVAGLEHDQFALPEALCLDTLVHKTVDELRPVAESRTLRLEITGSRLRHSCAVRREVASAVFRLLDAALGLAARNTILRVGLDSEPHQAAITVGWTEANGDRQHSVFQAQDLGLLVAHSAWQQAGGSWQKGGSPPNHVITICLPWAAANEHFPTRTCGDHQ